MPQPTLDFSATIAERAKDFTGREWVFRAIDTWLGDPRGARVFLLAGEPGSGKTTVAARLVQMSLGEVASKPYPHLGHDALACYHFCQANSDATLNPLRFVEVLSRALANRYDAFREALLKAGDRDITINATQSVTTAADGSQVQNVVIHELHIGALSARGAFDRAVRSPLQALVAGGFDQSIVVLGDSLDEALTFPGDENLVTLLRSAGDLPQQVRFVLTSRPDKRVTTALGEPTLDLIKDAPADVDDVRTYVEVRLGAQTDPPRKDFARRVAEASQGNFLYARYKVDEALPRLAKGEEPSAIELPVGLDGIYREFLKRELAANLDHWEERNRPVLGLLAVARGDGLTGDQIAHISKQERSQTDSILRRCKQFLAGPFPDGPFRIYHQSFRDFLWQDADFQVYPGEQHGRIIRYYLSRFVAGGEPWKSCDPYGLRQLVAHMQARLALEEDENEREQQVPELYAVVLDEAFRDAQRDRLGDLSTTLADLRTVMPIALERDDLIQALEMVGVYRRIKHGLTVTKGVFDAVQAGDFERALQRSRHYEVLPGLRGNWERALQLYLAWEAAEQGKPQAVSDIMASARHLPSTQVKWIDKLWDALLVRTARTLARTAGGGRDAQAWLAELAPGRDVDELLASYNLAQSPDPTRRAALVAKLDSRLADFRMQVDEDKVAPQATPFDEESMGAQAGDLRSLLVELAATGEGRAGIIEAREFVLPNPYPRYRDIGLVALGIACLSVPDASWVRPHVQSILETALNREGVTFTFDLPSILLEAVRTRAMPAPELSDKLSDYLHNALHSSNRWGTDIRAQSARAAALFWQGNSVEAFTTLQAAGCKKVGFAGYGVLTLLSLANRCYEFGEPARATKPMWGPHQDTSLLDWAEALADRVRDAQFRDERRQLVGDFRAWSEAGVPELKSVLTMLSKTPDPDTRGLYIDHVTARWASPGSRNLDGIKKLIPIALANATTLDVVLGRLFGLSLSQLSDADLAKAVQLCASDLLTDLPRT